VCVCGAGVCLSDFVRVCLCWDGVCLCVGRVFVLDIFVLCLCWFWEV